MLFVLKLENDDSYGGETIDKIYDLPVDNEFELRKLYTEVLVAKANEIGLNVQLTAQCVVKWLNGGPKNRYAKYQQLCKKYTIEDFITETYKPQEVPFNEIVL